MEQGVNRKALMILAIAVFVLSLIIQGVKASMVAAAQREVDRAAQRITQQADELGQLQQDLGKAKERHLSAYTKGVSLTQQEVDLEGARQLQERANWARHPNAKRDLARQAAERVDRVPGVLANQRQYLQLLDAALANYKTEPGKLAQESHQVKQYIEGLEREGYFASNFDDSRRLLVAADGRHTRAVHLSRQTFERDRPNYLAVYTTCLEGEQFSADAKKLAEAVPALRASNEARIAKLPNDASAVRQNYEQAWVAANQLEHYSRYRSLKQVESANQSFAEMERLWELAKQQNSMAKQQFESATQSLSQAESLLATANQVFTTARETWEKVQSAVRTIPSARDAAKDAIDRAHRHIRAYSHNSQGRAKGLVEDAEEKLSSGDILRHSDPPQSLECFREAKGLAEDAYRAVDTSSHTTTTIDTGTSDGDFGSGGGSLGGGSSGGDGGFGGPSGGGFGGPSGGGFGSGGF